MFVKNFIPIYSLVIILSFQCTIMEKDKSSVVKNQLKEIKENSIDTMAIENISEEFSRQNIIFNVVRLPLRYLDSLHEGFSNNFSYSYNVTIASDNVMTILFDNTKEQSEIDYWNSSSFENIQTTNNENLSQMISKAGITKELLLKFVDFLIENNFYSISKITGKQYIEIRSKINEGYLFNPENDVTPVKTDARVLNKLSSNLYFFIEHN